MCIYFEFENGKRVCVETKQAEDWRWQEGAKGKMVLTQ